VDEAEGSVKRSTTVLILLEKKKIESIMCTSRLSISPHQVSHDKRGGSVCESANHRTSIPRMQQ